MLSFRLVSPAQSSDRDWDRRNNQPYPRPYPNGRWEGDGRYNNSAYNRDEQKGYNDGLTRGRQDAQTYRTPTPNNSSHFRNGNDAYRAGSRRGYSEGYGMYSRGRQY